MADDIDIEEHDVLESLRLRLGPDAEGVHDAIVKSEPLEYDQYEEADLPCDWEWEKNAPDIKIEPCTPDDVPFGKIILGSKPATPPPEPLRQEDCNFNMSLVLEDWGPILEKSECYCQECQTLFATINALDSHKMLAHSFLVPIEEPTVEGRNKAFKSTAKSSKDKPTCKICHFEFKETKGKSNLNRHYRQVHQIDPATVANKEFKSWRVCNHCNLYFPNDTSLVKHLYELLPLNNKTPIKDDKKPIAVPAKPAFNLDKAKTVSKDMYQPNRIILGSKPMTVKTEPSVKAKKYKCETCNIQYHSNYYFVHMRKFHPKTFPKPQKPQSHQNQQNSPDKIILNDANVRYKCILCNQILLTHWLACKHRAKHPEMKRRKIIVKMVRNKAKPNPILPKPNPSLPIKVYKREPKPTVAEEDQGITVSKSILFKCNRCSVHFLTCTGACQHSIVCESSSNIRDWECPQCQKVFKSAEKSAHEYQHKVMKASKLKVYVVYLEMIVRVLCECPHCNVCFEEDKFWKHVNAGCKNDIESYYCSECRLPIDVHSKANHDSKHKQGDFTKDDFIKIDYISSKIILPKIKQEAEDSPRGTKRKLDVPVVLHKRIKHNPEHQFQFYYCSICKQYFGAKLDFHMSGKCKHTKKRFRRFCQLCGLYFSPKYMISHEKLHAMYPTLNLSNFTIMRMSDSKKIKPQSETYPCKKCGINFLTKLSRHTHKCGETDNVYCQICEKKIPKDMYKPHMHIHTYVIPAKPKSCPRVNDVSPKPLPQKQSNLAVTKFSPSKIPLKDLKPLTKLPDLLMKYQSLTALWNILYLCATCDTFTDSYDKVVEHCQNHLTNMENYGVVIMMCQICDMKFDSECYKRHLELHAGNKIINKKTFQILRYEYFNLFSNNWFDFIDLPDEQKSQIVERSIYGENRCVKMKLQQQGPPECTLYKCSKCANCVRADNIVHHVKLTQCVKANKVACSICEITFITRSQCEEHERIHQATGLGAESFRIVAFNDPGDADTNLKIMSHDTSDHGSKSRITFADDQPQPEPKLKAKTKHFVFYKCAQCHVSLVHLSNFKNHKCTSIKKAECFKCGLLFCAKQTKKHMELHEKYTISKKNIISKTVNKNGQVVNIVKQSHDAGATHKRPATDKPRLYKCYCGLHFTSLKTIEKHYKAKNCSAVVREKCSQCELMFDPTEVVNHLCRHHAQGHTSFDIVTPNKKTLYRCGECKVLFYNREVGMSHKKRCTGKNFGKKCLKCNLTFGAASLATHLADHGRNNKLRPDCYVLVNIDETPIAPVSSTLYRCNICDIHFLRRPSARNHLIHGRHGQTPERCKVCGLGFLPKTLAVHMQWQHHRLNIKKFDVQELVVGVNTKTPKMNTNVAIPLKAEPVKKVERKVTVYKCSKCALHFTEADSLLRHQESRCSKELHEECEDCAVKFASKHIKEHKQQHRPGVDLVLEVLEDGKVSDLVRKEAIEQPQMELEHKLYRCVGCKVYFNCKKTVFNHACNTDSIRFKCDVCDKHFKKNSLCRHKQIHEKYNLKKEDFVVVGVTDPDVKIKKEPKEYAKDTMVALGSSFEIEKSETPSKAKETNPKMDSNTHSLWKCAACDVYFVNQRACHKHIAKHTPFDSKDYIECKLCGFQFTILSLQTHIKKHHEDEFNLEEVLVEEYRPNDVKTFETYYASEKDPSRQVSTSDDVKRVANANEDNDNEVTSCNVIENLKSETDSSVTETDVKTDSVSNLAPTECSDSNAEVDSNLT